MILGCQMVSIDEYELNALWQVSITEETTSLFWFI